MKLTCKERVLTAMLGAMLALAITTLILILVEATSILLPADTKVRPALSRGRAGRRGVRPPALLTPVSLPVWDRV